MRRNQRLASEVYATAGRPCSFTVCCAPGRAPFVDENLASIAVECLLGQRHKSNCDVVVYCVMPDHVHLVVTPMVDGASSLQYIDRFKGWASYEAGRAGWTGYLWQRRSYDHVLRRDEDLEQIAAYILANPMRRGLCAEPEEYPWSGLPNPLSTTVSSR